MSIHQALEPLPPIVQVDAGHLAALEDVALATRQLIHGPCGWEYAEAYRDLRDRLLPRLDETEGLT